MERGPQAAGEGVVFIGASVGGVYDGPSESVGAGERLTAPNFWD
ncbi:hypothetical protein [Natronorubrum tibetense]|nr:hypothetical protein [Natronorubrum tibetense]